MQDKFPTGARSITTAVASESAEVVSLGGLSLSTVGPQGVGLLKLEVFVAHGVVQEA